LCTLVHRADLGEFGIAVASNTYLMEIMSDPENPLWQHPQLSLVELIYTRLYNGTPAGMMASMRGEGAGMVAGRPLGAKAVGTAAPTIQPLLALETQVFEGRPLVENQEELLAALAAPREGDTVAVAVVRAGATIELSDELKITNPAGCIIVAQPNAAGGEGEVKPVGDSDLSGAELKRAAMEGGLTFADVRGKSDDEIRARMANKAAATTISRSARGEGSTIGVYNGGKLRLEGLTLVNPGQVSVVFVNNKSHLDVRECDVSGHQGYNLVSGAVVAIEGGAIRNCASLGLETNQGIGAMTGTQATVSAFL
jgi:hypothetical protein